MEWLWLVLLAGICVWGYTKLTSGKVNKEMAAKSGTKATVTPVELPPSDFETVARESGWFVDPLPDWLMTAVRKHLDASETDQRVSTTALRSTGEALTNDEKRELGVRANAKLGRDYVEALSDKGKSENPINALKLVLLRCASRRSREKNLQEIAMIDQNIKVEIMSAGDERDCNGVRSYEGRSFSLERLPPLPLDGCDAEHCRCLYSPKIDEYLEKVERT